ncbi:MAG: sodium:solute symporter [Phaeodactylibacter sp.]|nr:sodium:solute symporter [Phaeodactylibacter sp.]
MESYGVLSLLPPILAIILAIRTKQVYISLLVGIWLGWVILDDWNILTGSLDTIQALVDVFSDPGNTRTIMFCALVGALILFIQRSGGVEGFILRINNQLEQLAGEVPGRQRKWVQFFAWLTGMILFVESSISVLTVGALFRPVFDRLGIPREKLAYIADSSSAPSSILIPLNGWGAYLMGLLALAGFDNPFGMMLKSMVFNFYPVLALLLVLYIIFSEWDFGPMAKAERRARDEGKLFADDAAPMVSEELTAVDVKPGVQAKAFNMILPIAFMVVMMPIMLIYTGWNEALQSIDTDTPLSQFLFLAIGKGSGSTAVLVAVTAAILFAMILYRVQGIFQWKEMVDLSLKGIAGLMPLALLMLLAFAIGGVCKQLHTGQYVADLASQWLSPALVPTIVFMISCFIAFATGTSWGTFAIMMAIAIPMAEQMDANIYMVIAAVMGGGVFGDHCSPISDTTILSSMASASDHIDHVKTQLPYALFAGAGAAILYLILGIVMHS